MKQSGHVGSSPEAEVSSALLGSSPRAFDRFDLPLAGCPLLKRGPVHAESPTRTNNLLLTMYECTKALMRRRYDPVWALHYLVGDALDIGAGPDGLSRQQSHWPRLTSVRDWDIPDGDAQELPGVAPATYDVVHSSHSLEHMQDPKAALARWWEVLKPGGHLIVIVPDEDMYEQGVFPSQFNRDHKFTFTLWKDESWSDVSVDLIAAVLDNCANAEILEARSLHSMYRWDAPNGIDQTLGVAEAALEIVVRKRTREEMERGGRLR